MTALEATIDRRPAPAARLDSFIRRSFPSLCNEADGSKHGQASPFAPWCGLAIASPVRHIAVRLEETPTWISANPTTNWSPVPRRAGTTMSCSRAVSGVLVVPSLLTAPIGPALLRLAGPTTAVMALQILVAMVDVWIIARLGTDFAGGHRACLSRHGADGEQRHGGMGGAVASALARALGAGRHEDARALVLQALVLAVICALVVPCSPGRRRTLSTACWAATAVRSSRRACLQQCRGTAVRRSSWPRSLSWQPCCAAPGDAATRPHPGHHLL